MITPINGEGLMVRPRQSEAGRRRASENDRGANKGSWRSRRGETRGGRADRQARGAIIAGFMYELLIESVVTS